MIKSPKKQRGDKGGDPTESERCREVVLRAGVMRVVHSPEYGYLMI